jgi:PAS domain S-box-containing protein
MNDEWKLWQCPPKTAFDTILFRYGVACLFTSLALLLAFRLSALGDLPFVLFFGAVTISALYGGLGPGVLATALSALAVSYCFVPPYYDLSLNGAAEDTVQTILFVLVSLMVSSFVAGTRSAKEHLRESEERYRILAQTACDAIIIVGQEDQILFVNPAAEKIFGYAVQQMLGKKFSLLVPKGLYDPYFVELKHDLDTRKEPAPLELSALHQSGRRIPLEITFGTFSRHGNDVFTAVVRDSTWRGNGRHQAMRASADLTPIAASAG